MRHSRTLFLIIQRSDFAPRHCILASDPPFKIDVLKGIASYSYIPRAFAYIAALAVIFTVFSINDSGYQTDPWIMSLLFFTCLVWPHAAYLWAKQSNQIQKAVTNSLLFDSFFGGFWMPLMSFELIPCSIFITVLMMNNISAGGFKLFMKGLGLMISSMILASLFIDLDIQYESKLIVILVCMPMITLYPMVLAAINYKLSRLLILQREKLLHLGRHDTLTGVFSRRYWEQRLLEEFERCQRSGENACVMMVDIDHFKNINDTYGHLVGDNVLKQFGQLLQLLRSSDITGRYGGEEFAILLPNSNLEKSLLVAERLRQDIENTQFDTIDTCTVSIGIASLDMRYTDAYKWLDNADKALYQAKKEGRNKVNIWLNTEMRSSSRAAV
jgi:diguanylate cyclase